MNVAPMILRFCSGSVTSVRRSRNRSVASTNSSVQPEPREARPHLLGLVQPEQAVVHEDARQPIAERLVQEHRGDRRVDAAGQPADDLAVADLCRGCARRSRRRTTSSSSRRCSRRRRTRSCGGSPCPCRCARPRDGTAGRRVVGPGPASPRPARWPRSRRRRSPAARRRRSRRGWPRPCSDAGTSLNSGRRRRRVTVACPNSRCGALPTCPPSASVISCMP